MRFRTGAFLILLAGTASIGRAQQPSPTREQAAASSTDAIDDVIRSEMHKRHIPGLSLAIIEGGKIVKAKGYGVTEKGGENPVTTSTLFQAGSISKPVSAMGALRLVQDGKLALDGDVNAKLSGWKVPDNEFTRQKKVTLRGLLSHTAGLTVHGFPGYATDKPVPTIIQILDGESPANTPAIRVDILPGSKWRYSGGGYTVMQKLTIDVTGTPFPRFMDETVLGPLGMNESTFEQPLPAEKAALTASGHYGDRRLVQGKWHIYPEMAAAGLWTTPSDLVRFDVGVQEAFTGQSAKTLSKQMAQQMLTEVKDHYGLGVSVQGSGRALRFGHGGRDEGFDALLVGFAETGQGAAIMINANDNSAMIGRIQKAIARGYHWPDYVATTASKQAATAVPEEKLNAYSGRYEFANNQMLTFTVDRGRLVTVVDGFPDEEFFFESDDRFGSSQRDFVVNFVKGGDGEIDGFRWKQGGEDRNAPRIGPLFHALKPQPDPDPARTEKVVTALKAFAQGGKAVADSPLLTAGARADLGGAVPTELAGIKSATFATEQDVASREIERHKGKVSRVLYYRLATEAGERCVLIHMTADGLITDYDIVTD
jgi:CubicO group peptidase (beta-lactamase class C family)